MAAGPENPKPFENVSNEDAKALFQENEPLVRFVLRRWFRGTYETELAEEDLRSIGQAALLRAWVSWKPEKGAWTTIAATCIRRAFWRALRLERLKPDSPRLRFIATDPTALEDPSPDDAESSGGMRARPSRLTVALQDHGVVETFYNSIETRQQLAWLHAQIERGLLSRRQAQIIRLQLKGHTYAETAEIIGNCSRQYVQIEYNTALEKLRVAASRSGLIDPPQQSPKETPEVSDAPLPARAEAG